MLTKAQLDKYKLLYLKRFGEEISEAQALQESLALIELVKSIAFETSVSTETDL